MSDEIGFSVSVAGAVLGAFCLEALFILAIYSTSPDEQCESYGHLTQQQVALMFDMDPQEAKEWKEGCLYKEFPSHK